MANGTWRASDAVFGKGPFVKMERMLRVVPGPSRFPEATRVTRTSIYTTTQRVIIMVRVLSGRIATVVEETKRRPDATFSKSSIGCDGIRLDDCPGAASINANSTGDPASPATDTDPVAAPEPATDTVPG